jgi:hypothetical protein
VGSPESAWTTVVGVGFLVWWIASAIHQLPPPWWKHVTSWDRLRMLPQWHFFAPRPGRKDHHLLIRDIVDGTPGEWREVPVGRPHAAWRWIWNPPRFRQKALIDLVNSLNNARRLFSEHGAGERSEALSLPYLALLAWVCGEPGAGPSCQRQFAIVASNGHDRRHFRVLYLSEPHTLADE